MLLIKETTVNITNVSLSHYNNVITLDLMIKLITLTHLKSKIKLKTSKYNYR